MLIRQNVDRGAFVAIVLQHLRGDGLRKCADAIRGDSVVGREHEHRRRAQHGRFGLQHRAELDRERFERAERALRLGARVEPALQRLRGYHVRHGGFVEFLMSPYRVPWGAHNA